MLKGIPPAHPPPLQKNEPSLTLSMAVTFTFTDHSPFKCNDSLSLLFLTVNTMQKEKQDHVKSEKKNIEHGIKSH